MHAALAPLQAEGRRASTLQSTLTLYATCMRAWLHSRMHVFFRAWVPSQCHSWSRATPQAGQRRQ